MRIAIVDDEEAECISLNKILDHWAGINHLSITCDCFSTGNDFLDAFAHRQYDLVFLDIYMDEIDGIQTAEKMRKASPGCCLIFLTSSREHMPKAFPCHAFDYLLKPLDEKRLFETLSDFLHVFPEKQPYINLPLGKQTVPVLYSHLEYIFTDSNYCIVQAQEQYRCRIPFNKLKAMLEDDERFCVINRGILVNLDYVDTMKDLSCWMKSGISFPINIRKNSELKQILINHRFNIRRKQLTRKK